MNDDSFQFWPPRGKASSAGLDRPCEHAGCALSDNMYENTRTTYTNAAVRLLAWQMPYHVEHHAFPAVPFHALSQVNALVRDRIEVSAPGYLALHRALIRQFCAARAIGHRETN